MTLFSDSKDYDRFIKLLYTTNSTNQKKFSDIETSPGKAWTFEKDETLVEIGAYCLMPNHFHLLLREKNESGISVFMQRLSTAYSMYFNKKYNHSGSVFQGKFKSQHADKDSYLKYLFSYIHLNPIKIIDSEWKEKGIKNLTEALSYLSTYEYSSYLDYKAKNKERLSAIILEKDNFPSYFKDIKDFDDEIITWLTSVQALPGQLHNAT